MKRFIKIALVIIFAAAVWSLAPVSLLYLRPDAAQYTNAEATAKLKNNTGDYFAFIVFSDNHAGLIFNDSSTLKMVNHINREDRFKKIPVDFVASAGDVTNRGSGWDYRAFNKIRSAIKWPVISAIGNHDDDKPGSAKDFKKYVGEAEFSFADRDSYFIFIDNSSNDITDDQFAKLEKELAKSLSYKHRFVIAHKSPLSLYQQSWFRPELSVWSYRFMKLCEKYKVDIVFSGHEHMFREAAYGGVKYITSGGGGMLTQIPEAEGGFLHYVVVRVYGDYLDYEVRKISPPLWEFLTYYMWKELFYYLRDAIF